MKATDLTSKKTLERLRLARADIPYIRRLPDEGYDKLREELFKMADQPNHARILIKGVTGIGKTREAIEFIKALDSRLPEDEKLTILIPRGDFDIPQEIPDDLRLNNLLLFVNDLHVKPLETKKGLSEGNDSFHACLVRVINYFDELCKGYSSFRVIAVTRSEPDNWERIHPNDPFWETFKIIDLPLLHSDCVPQAVESISKSFPKLEVEKGVSSIISQRNNGTFGSIITFMGNEVTLGNERISRKTATEGFSGSYRAYWDKNVFQKMIAPHPEKAKVFEALDILAQGAIPFYINIVEDLSSRLWRVSYPHFLKKLIIRKSILEMKAWLTKGDEFITCPEAYFEQRALLESYVKPLSDTVIHALSKHKNDRTLMNIAINLANSIENELSQRRVSLQIWKKLASIFPYEPHIHFSLSYALFWLGYLEKALLESVRTLELDPSFREIYCVRADILAYMGKYKAAENFYKIAVMLYEPTDPSIAWVLYERAQNLENLGKIDQAKEHYLKALEIDPEYHSARYALAQVYRRIGNSQEAAKQFELGTKTQPKWTATLTNLAKMYLAFDRFDEAINMFSAAIETSSAIEVLDYDLFNSRGVAYMARKLLEDANSDFQQARRLAQYALRKSRRNVNAHIGLLFAEIALKRRNALAKLSKLTRSADFVTELRYLLNNLRLMSRVNNDPVYSSAIQILEYRIMAAVIPQTVEQHIPLLTKLLRKRGHLANLTNFARTPLELLTSKAEQMQRNLETQQFIVEQEGVRVALSGDQRFDSIEVDGKLFNELPALLNQGIEKTQKLAAMILIRQVQSSDEEDEPRSPIPGLNIMSDMKKLQERALAMQGELETEIVEVRNGNNYAKFTGSQTLIDLEIEEISKESQIKLIEAINLALKKSQEAAAKTMFGLG